MAAHVRLSNVEERIRSTLPTLSYEDLDIGKMELPPGWRGYGAKNYIDNPETPDASGTKSTPSVPRLEAEGADRFAVQDATDAVPASLLPEAPAGQATNASTNPSS